MVCLQSWRSPRTLSLFCLCAAIFLSGCKGTETQASATTTPPGKKGGGKKGGGDVPVVVTKVAQREVPTEIEVIGNVEASSSVIIKPQVGGELTRMLFREGDFVTKGQPLFEIDRRVLEAQLAQARANLMRSEAMSRQAMANVGRSQAQLQYMKSQSERYLQLQKEGVMSREQTEQSVASARAQAEAVAADQAAIESSKAEIEAQKALIANLQVQLSFTRLAAPISGRTGTLMVKPGNIVQANVTELIQINQLQPVFVSFAIPEAQLRLVEGQFGRARVPVFAAPQDGGDTAQGTLTFVENSVDASTGTIRLRGTFPNPNQKLWPGEFVRVRMRLGSDPNAMILPNQAVQTGPDGEFVFVVREDRTAEMRPITSSQRSGSDVVIASGVKPGETVVTEGQLRLAPGMRVVVRDPSRRGGGPGGPGGEGRRKGEGKAEGESRSEGKTEGRGEAPSEGKRDGKGNWKGKSE